MEDNEKLSKKSTYYLDSKYIEVERKAYSKKFRRTGKMSHQANQYLTITYLTNVRTYSLHRYYVVYASVITKFDTTIHLQLPHVLKQEYRKAACVQLFPFKAGYALRTFCTTTFLLYRISIGGNKGVM